MRWFDAKRYVPANDTWVVVRTLNKHNDIDILYIHFCHNQYLDYDDVEHLFRGNVTHFCILDPIPIEEQI